MVKAALADVAVGTLLAGIVMAVLVPTVPSELRGPQTVLIGWLAVIVVYSMIRRGFWRRTP